MKILFDKANILFHDGTSLKGAYLVTEGKNISYISAEKPKGNFDRVIDCSKKIIAPGLYNCHTHSPMSIFRGYGENLPDTARIFLWTDGFPRRYGLQKINLREMMFILVLWFL